jgi:hypothetical protein
MRFPDAFLEELRQALPTIEIVSRRFKMRKVGSEYQSIDNPSLKVNPSKNVWREWGGSGQEKGGDIFEFEMFSTGCTFQEAVENLAQIAGIPLPRGHRPSKPVANGNGADHGPLGPEPPPHESAAAPASGRTGARKEITATYGYLDVDGTLVYQVCRQEWIGDDGKRRKAFMQRRPFGAIAERTEDQRWIWGLGAGVFLRGRDGNYYIANKDRLEKWVDAERITVDEECPHMLYRFPELREEMAQVPADRRICWVVEGEKDADTLVAWGLVATTNSGGAKNWRHEFAEEMRGADVVVLLDNDEAGRARGHAIALTLRGVAASVKALSWPEHWPACPPGGDVTDWRDKGGGTVERLFEIVDKLPAWSPPRPTSAFGAVRFEDIDNNPAPLHWTIKGILQRGTVSLWYGPPSCGKSFLLTDAAMAVARGIHWMERRTRPGLVVYQTGEGHTGFRLRLKAYRRANTIPSEEKPPFVYLPVRINLFLADADVDKLILELKAWEAFYNQPLELVVIDTFNAASGGANENANQDVGKVLDRCRKIAEVTGAHVAVVHHTPKDGGKPRGHSSLTGDVETTISVEETEELRTEEREGLPTIHRAVRTWTLVKQKDGPSKITHAFLLKQAVVGEKTEDGEEETSCVVAPLDTVAAAAERRPVPDGWVVLNSSNLDIFRALMRALKKNDRPATPEIGAPAGEMFCTVGDWQKELLETVVGHEEITSTVRSRIKGRVYRAQLGWLAEGGRGLIGKKGEYVWRTGRRVFMVDREPAAPKANIPKVTLAPGESASDLANGLDL